MAMKIFGGKKMRLKCPKCKYRLFEVNKELDKLVISCHRCDFKEVLQIGTPIKDDVKSDNISESAHN